MFISQSFILLLFPYFSFTNTLQTKDITPKKFNGVLTNSYKIPTECRFTIPRLNKHAPHIIYYFSIPKNTLSYPLVILCGGSSTRQSVSSIIHVHRHFLKECLELSAGVITLEQWGVDGPDINHYQFMHHYTRTQRLEDHHTVINFFITNPPNGWDGTFIFIGISEGGPLVTTLTQLNQSRTRATINFCGANGWKWEKELWAFIGYLRKYGPWYFKLADRLPYSPFNLPKSWKAFKAIMAKTKRNPTFEKTFLGMTYAYHADAIHTSEPHYDKIRTPFLVVGGTQDPAIESFDIFVQKAQKAPCPIAYLRIQGMDHYVRKRPDVIQQAFIWLRNQIEKSPQIR